MAKRVSLDELIGLTHERSSSGLPLDRLGAAVRLSGELGDLSDQLLSHFVQEARRAGCSWAQIGDVLGISRQAAQQRFVGRWLGRLKGRGKRGSAAGWAGYTDRARRIVELAQEEARRLDHNYVGTEHLLLGILREPRGVGAKALEALSISLDRIRDSVQAKIGRGDPSSVRLPIPFTPRAKKALDTSVGEAKSLGHNYVGTEHILLVLVGLGEGVAAEILEELGASKDRIRERILRLLAA
jgi:hypothetical protein